MSNVFEQTATVSTWDEDYYHSTAEQYYNEAVPTMLRLMGVRPGDMVLDAGCGPGVHAIRAVKYGCDVTAIDISKTMLVEAAARVAAAGVSSSVNFRQEDLTKLSLTDASFRFVFSWGVIIHIREVEKALSELARIVAPGGSLALYVTNDDSWDKKLEDFCRRLLRKPLRREDHSIGSGVWYDMHGEKLWVWQFNIAALEREMATLGFQLTDRRAGEYSDFQRRTKGLIRRGLLRLNTLLFRSRVSPRHAVANLLIFRKASNHTTLMRRDRD
jgi:ubiquinone/menaquinone biosynthesis C-methylase UbiE